MTAGARTCLRTGRGRRPRVCTGWPGRGRPPSSGRWARLGWCCVPGTPRSRRRRCGRCCLQVTALGRGQQASGPGPAGCQRWASPGQGRAGRVAAQRTMRRTHATSTRSRRRSAIAGRAGR